MYFSWYAHIHFHNLTHKAKLPALTVTLCSFFILQTTNTTGISSTKQKLDIHNSFCHGRLIALHQGRKSWPWLYHKCAQERVLHEEYFTIHKIWNKCLPSQVESCQPYHCRLHMSLCIINFNMLSIICGTTAGIDHVILMQSAITQESGTQSDEPSKVACTSKNRNKYTQH